MITKTLPIVVNKPTESGRIYGKHILKSIIDCINSKPMIVYLDKPRSEEEFSIRHIFGVTAGAELKDSRVHINITTSCQTTMLPKEIIDSVILRPWGQGEITNEGKVFNYTLMGLFVTKAE